MKKKILLVMGILTLSFIGSSYESIESYAQGEDATNQDYSYLFTSDAIIGQTEPNERGVYLSYGTSVIKDAGTGKIVAGGVTNAAKQCDVTVNVIVERLSGGSWARVTSWTASKDNAWTVGSSKTLSVGSGYYYRVRSLHFAHTDASSSWTGNLWK